MVFRVQGGGGGGGGWGGIGFPAGQQMSTKATGE